MSSLSDMVVTLWSRRRQLLLVLAAAVLLTLGMMTPVMAYLFPGIDINAAAQLSTISIFTHGYMGWLTAWALVQLFQLVRHRFTAQRDVETPLTNPFSPLVVALALLLSSVSWLGIFLGVVPSFTQRDMTSLEIIMGLIVGAAGTSLYIYAGHLLDRAKPGYGFWLLLLMQALWNSGKTLFPTIDVIRTGVGAPKHLVLIMALLIMNFIVAVIMVHRSQAAENRGIRHLFVIGLLGIMVSSLVSPYIYMVLDAVGVPNVSGDATSFYQLALSSLPQVIQLICYALVAWLVLGRLSKLATQWQVMAGIAFILLANEVPFFLSLPTWPDFWPLHFMMMAWLSSAALRVLKIDANTIAAPPPDEDQLDADFRRGWR